VETTPLYRAVTPAELRDLARQAGVLSNLPGVEVKYFSETAEGAASYAQHTLWEMGTIAEGVVKEIVT